MFKEIIPGSKGCFYQSLYGQKSRGQRPRQADAIDFVITYQELKEVFTVLELEPGQLPEDDKDHASFAGRLYARTGGVSLSVKTAVNRIAPDRLINLRAKRVDGVKACKEILDKLKNGEALDANFIEGMGCEGGCVGGPKTNIDKVKAREIVNEYSEESLIMTPMDNMNIIRILGELGLKDFSDIYKNEAIVYLLSRNISTVRKEK
ncbi:MAG: [Fe-Fe] hydrogenase large subunit C-terminal domain-containing protein [Halanaerobiales bacterium]